MKTMMKITLLLVFLHVAVISARYRHNSNKRTEPNTEQSYTFWKQDQDVGSRAHSTSNYMQDAPYYDEYHQQQRSQHYGYSDFDYGYNEVKSRQTAAPLNSVFSQVAAFVSSGFRNFAKEFDDVMESRQDVQDLFSSSAVAIPLAVLASVLLFRDPLFDLLDKKETTTEESTTIAVTSLPDLCANLECSGLGSNLCVDGKCVCGSSGGTCPDTMPVCFGEGATATCVCYPGSCQEPNPVCDPTDGTCKCNIGTTKVTCTDGYSDSCSSTDGSGMCVCGSTSQCSDATPKCDTTAIPPVCVACDATFCQQPLPWCVPAGTAGEGSCQCGSSTTCGTADQTGNRCTEDDASGVCMCGESALCTQGSTVESCLNNAAPPVFVAGDMSSTCKCAGSSCTTASVGVVPSNGACSVTADATLGTCVSCNVDGEPGDGTSQGSCPSNLKCHVDGSCSLCSSTAGGLAGTDVTPHSGCLALNPRCNAGGTECQCDTAASTICDALVSTTCANADTIGVCMCGGDPACSGTTPNCDTTPDPAMCIACTIDTGNPGEVQGTCSSASLMCLGDGSCQCQLDMAGGGPGDGTAAGTCTEAGQLCLDTGLCKCQIDNAGGGDADGTVQGTCAMGEACNADGTCSSCNVDGNPGDGTMQGTCSSDSLRCSAMGTCLCRLDDTDTPGDGTTAGTCTGDGQLCLDTGLCKCQADNAGGGDGDGTMQGTCMMGEVCNADGSCFACNVDGNPGDGTMQGNCPADCCQADGTCAACI